MHTLAVSHTLFLFRKKWIYINKINTFIFDVDGVFTDNGVLVTEEGGLLRKMSVHDGYAVKHALDRGYRVCIITGGTSEGVVKRFRNLGVMDIYSGVGDKFPVFEIDLRTYNHIDRIEMYAEFSTVYGFK